MGRYCFGQKPKSDISVCSLSWSRTTSGYIGQLYRNFSLQIGCRYGWTTIRFSANPFPGRNRNQIFRCAHCLGAERHLLILGNSTEIFSTDWLSLWINDIRFSANPSPAEIEIRYFGVLTVFEQNDTWISRATSQNFFPRDWLSYWGMAFYFSVNPFFDKYKILFWNLLYIFLAISKTCT